MAFNLDSHIKLKQYLHQLKCLITLMIAIGFVCPNVAKFKVKRFQ
ncbi:hypothetical protein C8P68_104125 [Mucilaginibacter yixingensis]|uniref:Uncharacterized protein n=1 Tax=Mucilaginibacter yixingensis TaxID=1295612 RepID=A0A2T5J995_9SPHI|nr:hypothetical protein C8P68_104125 [Mucilaginibacter yixingensis]